MMLVGAIAPKLILTFKNNLRIEAFRDACERLPLWIRSGLILLMIAITLGAALVFHANPKDYSYVPLVIPVIVIAAFFDFFSALFAIFVTAFGDDYFFAHPQSSFALTDWEDALGLVVFAIFGALVALAIDEFLDFLRATKALQ